MNHQKFGKRKVNNINHGQNIDSNKICNAMNISNSTLESYTDDYNGDDIIIKYMSNMKEIVVTNNQDLNEENFIVYK